MLLPQRRALCRSEAVPAAAVAIFLKLNCEISESDPLISNWRNGLNYEITTQFTTSMQRVLPSVYQNLTLEKQCAILINLHKHWPQWCASSDTVN
ncbi:uncharacterized protein V6R79_011349 [Siganus canaliculatus]